LAGHYEDIYDIEKLHAVAQQITGNMNVPTEGWYYPPTFSLIVFLFAKFPYVLVLFFWVAITLFGYITVVRKIAPHQYTLGLALAYPGTFQNFIHGQNGFFTAYLLGQGLLLIDNQPRMAGILLGLLVCKPHIGVLVGVALLAGSKWKTLVSACVSAMVLIVSSILVFGIGSWKAFFATIPFVRVLIEVGYLPWFKMSSFFAAARLLGINSATAYTIQLVVSVLVAVLVFWIWRKGTFALACTVLTCSIILATPYSFQYDLTIVGLGIAWYGLEGIQKGWLPGEKYLLVIAWLASLVNAPIAKHIHIQIIPFILLAIVFLAIRRQFFMKKANDTVVTI
jgi:hypothetical protein